MKILAFAASNSTTSVNQQLVRYATSLLDQHEVEILDINDYEMPLYSSDREGNSGIPDLAHAFRAKINNADAVLISFAEHNGSYSAAYKNLFDWTSRINPKVYQDKKMILMATSPGAGGASNVLAAAKNSAPHFGAEVIGDFSLPGFYDKFDSEMLKITDLAKSEELSGVLSVLG